MIQIQANGEKPHFGPELGPLNPNSGRQIFFSKMWLCQSLNILVRYQLGKYKKKLMIQS